MHFLIDNINNYKTEDYNYFFSLIKKDKQNKISLLKNEKLKKMLILEEYLLIKSLKNYYNIDYNNLIIETNNFGKSYILNYNLFFNTSHFEPYVSCCLSQNKIGCSIEKIRDINENSTNQFINYNEKKDIFENEASINRKYYTIFALKEAYLKVKENNLNKIKVIEFNIKNEKIICNDKYIKASIDYFDKNYIIAICEYIKTR